MNAQFDRQADRFDKLHEQIDAAVRAGQMPFKEAIAAHEHLYEVQEIEKNAAKVAHEEAKAKRSIAWRNGLIGGAVLVFAICIGTPLLISGLSKARLIVS